MEVPILYEDDILLAVDKPAGMVVNDAANVSDTTLAQIMAHRLKIDTKGDKNDSFACRAGIVHRLDKQTSGIVLVAKNPVAFAALQNQFLVRSVEKEYIALVHGQLTPLQGVIRAPIGRLPWKRTHFGVIPEGRPAHTTYSVEQLYLLKGQIYTLICLIPHTGRTNKLRGHSAWIGHSIVSDPLYCGRKTLVLDLAFCSRMFLHARKIGFQHPHLQKRLIIESKLPDDLQKVITQLTFFTD